MHTRAHHLVPMLLVPYSPFDVPQSRHARFAALHIRGVAPPTPVLLPPQPMQPWPQTGVDTLSKQCVDSALRAHAGKLLPEHRQTPGTGHYNGSFGSNRFQHQQQQRVWDAHGSGGATPPTFTHVFVLNPFQLQSDPHIDGMLASVIRALTHALSTSLPPESPPLVIEVLIITTVVTPSLSPSTSPPPSPTGHNITDALIEGMIRAHLTRRADDGHSNSPASTSAVDALHHAVKRSIKVLPALDASRTSGSELKARGYDIEPDEGSLSTPLLSDILQAAYAYASAEQIIWTHSDVELGPTFYTAVASNVARGGVGPMPAANAPTQSCSTPFCPEAWNNPRPHQPLNKLRNHAPPTILHDQGSDHTRSRNNRLPGYFSILQTAPLPFPTPRPSPAPPPPFNHKSTTTHPPPPTTRSPPAGQEAARTIVTIPSKVAILVLSRRTAYVALHKFIVWYNAGCLHVLKGTNEGQSGSKTMAM